MWVWVCVCVLLLFVFCLFVCLFIFQIFSGSSDSETIVTRIFAEAVVAQYVRIRPTEWNGSISLRLELLGCSGESIKGFVQINVCALKNEKK